MQGCSHGNVGSNQSWSSLDMGFSARFTIVYSKEKVSELMGDVMCLC